MLRIKWGRRVTHGIAGALSGSTSAANATKACLPRSANFSSVGPIKSFTSLQRVRIGGVVLPASAAFVLTRHLAAAATRKKTATKKKPAAKKKPTAKKTTAAKKKPAAKKKKPAAKKKTKTAAKKKKPALKKKVATKPPKPLVREHVAKSLKGPPKFIGPLSLFIKEHKSEVIGNSADSFKQLGAKYKALSDAEKENYTKRAHELSLKLKQEHEAWLNNLTPAQVSAANRSRYLLRNTIDTKYKSAKRVRYLKPSSRVRRAKTAFNFFVQDYFKKLPDGHGQKAPDVLRDSAKAFKALSASELKPYQDLYEADKKRYKAEIKAQ